MEPSSVKNYCEYIFKKANLGTFINWWVSVDSDLEAKPCDLCIDDHRSVIARAEEICDFTGTVQT